MFAVSIMGLKPIRVALINGCFYCADVRRRGQGRLGYEVLSGRMWPVYLGLDVIVCDGRADSRRETRARGEV